MIRAGLLILTAIVGVLVAAAPAGALPAPGWMASHPEAEQQAIVDYVYENAPQGVTPYPGGPATDGGQMAAAMRAADDQGAQEIGALAAEQLTLLRESGGLLPGVGASVPALYAGAAAAGTFAAGWQIGTGVRSIIIDLVSPDASAQPGAFQYGHIYWAPKDENIYYGARVEQSPGAYLFAGSQGGSMFLPVRWFEPPCGFSGFSGPPGARMQNAVASTARCVVPNTFPEQEAEVLVDYPYLLETDLSTHHPLRLYDPQRDPRPDAITPAPPDPGVGTTRPSIGTALERDGQDLQRAELNYLLDPDQDPSEDPLEVGIGTEDPNDRCRISPETKAQNSTIDPWSLKQMFARRDSSGPTVDAPLLWGKVIPRAPGEPDPDFKGFGFRKIIQYHGWTSVDINSTRQALKRPPVEVTQATSKIPERQIYDGPTYTPGPGAEPGQYCRRRVVVETQSRAGEPRARGIITSYGRLFDL